MSVRPTFAEASAAYEATRVFCGFAPDEVVSCWNAYDTREFLSLARGTLGKYSTDHTLFWLCLKQTLALDALRRGLRHDRSTSALMRAVGAALMTEDVIRWSRGRS